VNASVPPAPKRRALALTLAGCLPLALLVAAPTRAAGNPEHGKVLFALAAGCGCHTADTGPVGAGGGAVPTPFGTFFGTNITPDPDTGIGHWSDAEIDAAIRRGVRRDHAIESPAMPYYQYAGMADADVADLIAYLRTLPAVRRSNQPHTAELPLARLAYRAWRLLFFRPPPAPPLPPSTAGPRARYLVEHVSICVDCHTPRNRFGVPVDSLYLAGSAHGPGGHSVPNITADATGIGAWDADDIYNVLTSGRLPDFDNVQGLMQDVVDGRGGGPGYKDAPESDRRAIAAYIKRLPPIANAVDDK
jgi:mono/diheme cytochrome c family protein